MEVMSPSMRMLIGASYSVCAANHIFRKDLHSSSVSVTATNREPEVVKSLLTLSLEIYFR